MSGKVVHFEVPADDVQRARTFYREAFGWRLDDMPGAEYTVITTVDSDGRGVPKEAGAINGGMYQRQPELSAPLFVIDVADIDEGLQRVGALGGTVVRGRQDVGDLGYSAYFTDSEGNTIGLWQNKP